ncbi:AgrD family cyclic lactone autoinducer peptide, partial [Methanoregula sp.]
MGFRLMVKKVAVFGASTACQWALY